MGRPVIRTVVKLRSSNLLCSRSFCHSHLAELTMRKSLTVASILLCTLPSVALSRGSMEAAAAKLSHHYLGVWSSNSSAAVRQVSFIYGSRVRFYGRHLNRSAL